MSQWVERGRAESSPTTSAPSVSSACASSSLVGIVAPRSPHPALEKVRADGPPLDVEIRMHPFQLNGMISDAPMKRSEYGEKKFGHDSWQAVCQSLACKFRQVGID